MAGLVPAIHVFTFASREKDMDARDKPGHDDVIERVTSNEINNSRKETPDGV